MPGRPRLRDLNPTARPGEYAAVRRLARAEADVEREHGAIAVVLAGSWARGDAHRGSDVDLWAIGRTPGHDLREVEGRIVSVSRKTAAELRTELRSPRWAGIVVPAWRWARILFDPRGVAHRLQNQARRFRWDAIGPQCDRYVAASIVEWAEEAVKLTRLWADGRRESAAVQRNLLVNAMAGLLAIDRRLLYSENELWERVAHGMGPSWHRLQARALALGGESLEASCRAALDLYRVTAEALDPRLKVRQRRVVEAACAVFGGARPVTSTE